MYLIDHQRVLRQLIASGDVHAERHGHVWAIDPRSVNDYDRRRRPTAGRSLSPTMAWAAMLSSFGTDTTDELAFAFDLHGTERVAELADRLGPKSWVLIGGQLVALHVHLAGATPRRTTTDVDIVADVLADRSSFQACKAVALAMGLEARPSMTGQNLHRFVGPTGRLDLMVPDHLPAHLTRDFTTPLRDLSKYG